MYGFLFVLFISECHSEMSFCDLKILRYVCRLQSVLFLCTVHISGVPSGKCSVSVHSTHFCCTVWRVFYFCAQFTFLTPNYVKFLSNRIPRSVARGFMLLGLLRCDFTVVKTVPVPV